MDVRISPRLLHGTCAAIPSKSDLHRALICAAFSDRATRIETGRALLSEDILATAEALCAMGAEISRTEDALTVIPCGSLPKETPRIDCRESGSTLRFLLPVAAAYLAEAQFTGSGRLPERPLAPLPELLKEKGCTFSSETLPFTVTGFTATSFTATDPGDPVSAKAGLTGSGSAVHGFAASGPREFSLPGNISSQYITGLLLAAPLMGGVRIRLTTKLESAAYVDMTIRTMRAFGVETVRTEDGFLVSADEGTPLRYLSPGEYPADGDWSNSACLLAAGILSEELSGGTCSVHVTGLDPASPQGDKACAGLLQEIRAAKEPCTVDVSGIPDLVPVLAAFAAALGKTLQITGGARLRIKESDRIASTADLLTRLGASVRESADGLTVWPDGTAPSLSASLGPVLTGGEVYSHHDHRIVMAAALASVACKEDLLLRDAGAAAKSYPSFFEDFSYLGGNVHVL